MCTKRVVNHEDGRGGQEQMDPRRRTVSPPGLVVGQRDAGEVNLPRNVVNSHLEWVRKSAFLQRSLASLELRRDCAVTAGLRSSRFVLPVGMRREMSPSYSLGLSFTLTLANSVE